VRPTRKQKPRDSGIPDVSKWVPRKDKSSTLASTFHSRCQSVEELVKIRVEHERRLNIDNFDSGPSSEDILRDEIGKLLPKRYSVTAGVVSDRLGQTGGDFDILIFNDFWFPSVKAGATQSSRRVHYPIEGVYALLEVKQSLSKKTLDDAMRKLVVGHRLDRPVVSGERYVENRTSGSCTHHIPNPLYSAIVAVGLADGADFLSLVNRFCVINQQLERLSVVRSLCVLGEGTVVWGCQPMGLSEAKPAKFMNDDLYERIFPVLTEAQDSRSSLYTLMTDLFGHLQSSILAPEDIPSHYGDKSPAVKTPTGGSFFLEPDADWLARLDEPCDEDAHLP
jgi:hypothetical protein